jgi:two-component system, NarL family, response regulator NreC
MLGIATVFESSELAKDLLTIEDQRQGFGSEREKKCLLGSGEKIMPRPGSAPSITLSSRYSRSEEMAHSGSTSPENSMTSIRIVLADDHTIMRNGLRLLLERQADFLVVGEASNGREALDVVARETPEIVIMDISMPLLNGIEAARRITAEYPKTGVLILSMHSDEGYILKALKAGTRGYLLKDSAEADLIQAVRAVCAGKAFFSPAVSKVLADDYLRQIRQQGTEDPYELLTARERELLQLVAELKSTKEIADLLGLSPHTVDRHRGNLMQKLNVHSIPEIILYAVRKGLIS